MSQVSLLAAIMAAIELTCQEQRVLKFVPYGRLDLSISFKIDTTSRLGNWH